MFLVDFCSVFESKCLEDQRPHFLGIMVFGGAVPGRGWTWPARGGGGVGLLSLSDAEAPGRTGRIVSCKQALLAPYVRPPGHSTRRRQLSSIPTWQPWSPGLSQEFPFPSWKKCPAGGFLARDRKGRGRKGRAFELNEAPFRA